MQTSFLTIAPSRYRRYEPSLWRDLRAGDIFFVDSSHVFKAGSDVEFEFLTDLPFIASRGIPPSARHLLARRLSAGVGPPRVAILE